MKMRKNYRQNIDLIATLHTDKASHDILIKDISIGGLHIELRDTSLSDEQTVILDIPMFRKIKASVAWKNGFCHGIKFIDCPSSVHRFLESINNFDAQTEYQHA